MRGSATPGDGSLSGTHGSAAHPAWIGSPGRIIGVYLLVVAPPIALGPWSLAHTAFAAAHLAIAGLLMSGFVERRSPGGPLGWPVLMGVLFALPLLYMEIPALNQALTAGYKDPIVSAWEAVMFGSPATDWAGSQPNVLMSEVFHFLYLAFYPAIYVPPVLLLLRNRQDEARANAAALLLAATACYVVFVYFPVQGPRYFGPPEGVPDGPIRRLTLNVLESGSSRGAAFPSSHMSITVAQAAFHLRLQRNVGIGVALIAAGVGLGAVYGGFHYGVDMVVGLGIGVIAAMVAFGTLRPAAPDAGTP